MDAIIITLKTLPELERYTIWESLDSPECPYCKNDMAQVSDDSEYYEDELESLDVDEELWICQFCGETQNYRGNYYGEREQEITKDEYEAIQSEDRQESLLLRRYGTIHPKSIRDYWVNVK